MVRVFVLEVPDYKSAMLMYFYIYMYTYIHTYTHEGGPIST